MKSKKLGDIFTISKGRKHSITKTIQPNSKRIIGISDLRNDENIIYTNDKNGTEVIPDDIMIAWDGANSGTIGFGKRGVIGSTISRLRRKEKENFHTPFIGIFLKTKFNYLRKTATGATIPHINRSALERIKLPQLNIEEQIRIATLLSRVETLIAIRKNSLYMLDEFLKSTFLEMFGPTNLDFSSWPLTEIKELASNQKSAIRTGPFGSNLLHSEFKKTGDVAVLGIDNAVNNKFVWGEKRFITREKYESFKNYRIFPGDVIITIMGTIGRSAVIPDNIPLAINTKHLAAITLDKEKANPYFVSYSIHSSPFIIRQFFRKSHGAIMGGLNLGIIKETKLRRPPIELQNRFANILLKVETIKELFNKSLNDLENLYGTLSQKAFKGEMDLSRIPLENVPEELVSHVDIGLADLFAKWDQAVLSRPGEREKLLHQLFDSFIAEQKGAYFILDDFLSLAEQQVLNLINDKIPPLGVNDYDKIKGWLFELLKKGSITQFFDEENNLMRLSVKRQ
jgi:type I restriction enzyme, S subunit